MGRASRSFLLIVAAALAAGSAWAASGGLTVELNDSKPVGLYGAAANVIVGDPKIADVTVVDSHTLVVSGRGYGRTHVIVLDANGRTLLDTHVSVVAPDDGRVTLYRGAVASNFNCSPRCQSIDESANAAAASPAGPTSQSSAN